MTWIEIIREVLMALINFWPNVLKIIFDFLAAILG